MTESDLNLLNLMEESGVISTSEKNLRSKIDSITRSLENLSEKKARIDFEIKRQKRSLTRKRAELKKSQRSTQAKFSLSLESGRIYPGPISQIDPRDIQVLDSKLLQESNQVLDN